MGNDRRLEDDEHGIDKEDAGGGAQVGGTGRRLGDLGKLPFWDNSKRLGEDAENEAEWTAGDCEHE